MGRGEVGPGRYLLSGFVPKRPFPVSTEKRVFLRLIFSFLYALFGCSDEVGAGIGFLLLKLATKGERAWRQCHFPTASK